MTDTQWFREAGFGLFIHWGLYALQGLGEWAMYTSAIPAEEYRALPIASAPGISTRTSGRSWPAARACATWS